MKQGFDRFYGYNCQRNAHSFYPPFLDSDEKEEKINDNPIPGHSRKKEGEVKADDYRDQNYAPDLILKEAVKFIDENKDKPFFLYLPFVEPHVAMHPPQEWVDKYPKEWDEKPYRGNRGYIPNPRPRAGYAAMISDLDEHVGTIMTKLKEYGLDENTIVIFTSDNGPTHDVGGVETNFFESAGGLRGRKGSCYEGGLRVPCIVRWKAKVKAGSETNVPSYFPDWFPTLTTIGKGKMTNEKLDGIDLNPVIAGGEAKRNDPMIWEFAGYGGIIAIRDGKWKALRRGLKKKKPQAWELYDLEVDPQEKVNLAEKHPDIVKRLEKQWLATRTQADAFKAKLLDGKKELP
eukprot:Seg20232.1 transcript_id=Seg20232.1/GoldUCD/mRNA.D3Y31 product="Arylsulfatase I" protein_id=Seg20232.1/GoldUCD/D3Y31